MTRDEAAREAAQRYVESGAPSSEQQELLQAAYIEKCGLIAEVGDE
ncbi:hypothetical protein [Gulosibacter molinativorax]|nr:hypothetical protein [Gulosibacter molinativorax]QUY60879.1 Hypotetical protein [Gulosibacter molinativorax]